MSKASILLWAALVAACTDAPTAVTSAEAGDLPGSSAAINPFDQRAQIEGLVVAGEAAWLAKDPAAYAALFAEDVEFISPYGTFLSGREAVRAQHVLLFGGPFAGSTLDIGVRRIAFLTGTVAIAELSYTLTGYRFLTSGLRETEPGVFRLTVRWVVAKRGERWQVLAHQMTPWPPLP